MVRFKANKPEAKPELRLLTFRFPIALAARLNKAAEHVGVSSTALVIQMVEACLKDLERGYGVGKKRK